MQQETSSRALQGTSSAETDSEAASGTPTGELWRAGDLYIRQYKTEDDLALVMRLIDNELSEPYSIFTYRYFIYNWPNLCYLAFDASTGHAFGTVVCKLDDHRGTMRGYLAMLTVEKEYRGKMIGSRLVQLAIEEMVRCCAEEVVLEAEVNNFGALRLYANLGFIRDKRLHRYYLNGVDAFRLKLMIPRDVVRTNQEVYGGNGGLVTEDGAGWEELTGMEPAVQKLVV